MTLPLETVVAFAGLVLWAVIVLSMTLSGLLYSRLRRKHRGYWEQLGSPTLIINSSVRSQFRSMRFVWLSKYRELNDAFLARLALALKAVQVLGLFDLLIVALTLPRFLGGR